MAASDIVQIAVLLLLGLAALSPRYFFAMLVLGCAIAGGLRFGGWHWAAALQASLAGCLCLPAFRWCASGRLLVASAVLIAVPTLLVSRFGFGVTWLLSAVNAAVLLVLLPLGILRSLVRSGLVQEPEPKLELKPEPSLSYSNFSSSAPSYPSRSECRR